MVRLGYFNWSFYLNFLFRLSRHCHFRIFDMPFFKPTQWIYCTGVTGRLTCENGHQSDTLEQLGNPSDLLPSSFVLWSFYFRDKYQTTRKEIFNQCTSAKVFSNNWNIKVNRTIVPAMLYLERPTHIERSIKNSEICIFVEAIKKILLKSRYTLQHYVLKPLMHKVSNVKWVWKLISHIYGLINIRISEKHAQL